MEDVEEDRFRRRVKSVSSDVDEIDTSSGIYGYHARITGMNGDDIQQAIDRIERYDDLEFAVTETSKGPGMEVWTK